MPTKPVPIIPLVVSPDDYKNMFGQDLAAALNCQENESDYPNIFLREVQEFLMEWCDVSGFRVIKFNELNPTQLEAFQRAILQQARYARINGSLALGLESGVDGERGQIIPLEVIRAVEVSPRVVLLLKRSGLFNLKIKNRPRINRGYPGIYGAYTGEDY